MALIAKKKMIGKGQAFVVDFPEAHLQGMSWCWSHLFHWLEGCSWWS